MILSETVIIDKVMVIYIVKYCKFNNLSVLSLYSTRTQNTWRRGRRQNCALPNVKYTNMLVSLALGDANFLRRPCTFHFFV